MYNLTLGEWRAPCLSRVPSQHSENSGACEIILNDVLCAKSANEYKVNNHFEDNEPTDKCGGAEIRLPSGGYVFGRIHVYPSAVTRCECSDVRIIICHPCVTLHVLEACYNANGTFWPLIAFLP